MPEPHDHDPLRARRRALWWALALNGGYTFAEVAGGVAFRSLALLADAAHMLSDVGALAIALVAQRLMQKEASARHTYGLQRAEVLGALTNGVLLFAATGWIFFEAYRRLRDPSDVAGVGLLVVATVGLVVNLVSAFLLHRAGANSLNMRGALIHMLADAAGSIAVIGAAVSVIVWGADWVDPAVSALIGVLVLWATWGLMQDTVHVLMEGAPRGMNPAEVERAIEGDRSVESVHHLHLWSLASEVPALSAHVVLKGEVTLHEAQERGDRLKKMLGERFGIEHATLELECHECEEVQVPSPISPVTRARQNRDQ